jgi:arsenate reductase
MNKTITVYGISNCDTVKKARAWLAAHDIEYRFHDFRKDGLPLEHARQWLASAGWETLLNRKGTSWRKLDDATREGVVDAASALSVMQRQPSVIKRPVVEWGQEVTVGFDPARWEPLTLR